MLPMPFFYSGHNAFVRLRTSWGIKRHDPNIGMAMSSF